MQAEDGKLCNDGLSVHKASLAFVYHQTFHINSFATNIGIFMACSGHTSADTSNAFGLLESWTIHFIESLSDSGH